MKIEIRFFTAIAVFLFLPLIPVVAQKNGEEIFKETCTACHTIGSGKLVGPDLANVQKRHSEDWIRNFVKSSQTVIKSGDKYADSLFKAFNQIQMPDHPTLTDEQIKGIVAYISEKSSAPAAAAATASIAVVTGNSTRGRDLFDGKIRFTNRGAACNSCHNVDIKGFISGGALGKDLTHAITRLSEPGVTGIISGLPFPQMKETYGTRPVTSQEMADITAFLTTADKQASTKAAGDVGNYLLTGGVAGTILLLVLFTLFWINRKNKTVNLAIYKRQIKSA
ncbi:MAG: cytochrome c [Ferruginibacter sp.]